MAIKVIGVIVAVISLVGAVPVEYPDGTVVKTVASSGYKQKNLDYQNDDDHAEYSFSYAVHDEHTGDIKSHQESRKGDVVQGRYELIDSDGHRRIVEYTADDHSGFNAVVHREPTDIRIPQPHIPQTQKIITSLPGRQLAAPLTKIAAANHGLVQNY